MEVVRIIDDELGSGHIEPPLDQDWDAMTKLQWKVACTRMDTGLPVYVELARYKRNGVPTVAYNVRTASHAALALDFASVWDYLNGIDFGVEELRKQQARDSW